MSQQEGIAFCERLFARYLDGQRLMSNAKHLRGSAIWIRFPRVICERWTHWNERGHRRVPVVLMGDFNSLRGSPPFRISSSAVRSQKRTGWQGCASVSSPARRKSSPSSRRSFRHTR